MSNILFNGAAVVSVCSVGSFPRVIAVKFVQVGPANGLEQLSYRLVCRLMWADLGSFSPNVHIEIPR